MSGTIFIYLFIFVQAIFLYGDSFWPLFSDTTVSESPGEWVRYHLEGLLHHTVPNRCGQACSGPMPEEAWPCRLVRAIAQTCYFGFIQAHSSAGSNCPDDQLKGNL